MKITSEILQQTEVSVLVVGLYGVCIVTPL